MTNAASSVALWVGRANNAWGASRQWNVGTSWEDAYNTEVGLYNATVALLPPTDILRTRVVLSGPAVGVETTAIHNNSVPENTLGSAVAAGGVTVPKNGEYTVTVLVAALSNAAIGAIINSLRLRLNGVSVAGAYGYPVANTTWLRDGFEIRATLAAGDVLSVTYQPSAGNVQIGNGVSYLTITFIPDRTYPN